MPQKLGPCCIPLCVFLTLLVPFHVTKERAAQNIMNEPLQGIKSPHHKVSHKGAQMFQTKREECCSETAEMPL